MQRARGELCDAGYLLYEHDPGTRTVKYYLISNVHPHMLVTPEDMLAGTKSYRSLAASEPQLPKEDSDDTNKACTGTVPGH